MNETWKYLTKDRYAEFLGFKFDKWLFQVAFFVSIALIFYVAWSADFRMNSLTCVQEPGSAEMCKNPFYEPSDWTNWKELPTGHYGYEPTPLFNNLLWIIAGILGIVMVFNKLFYFPHKSFFKMIIGKLRNFDGDKKE